MASPVTRGEAAVKGSTPVRLSSRANHSTSGMRVPIPQASIHGAQKPSVMTTAMMPMRSRNSVFVAPMLLSLLPEFSIRSVATA